MIYFSVSVTPLVSSPSILKNLFDSIILKLKYSYFLTDYSPGVTVFTDLAASSFKNFSTSFSVTSFLTTEITTVLGSLTFLRLP